MGVKRVTIRLRPNIYGGKEFRQDILDCIKFLNEKSPQYFAYCFEQNNGKEKENEEDEVHFHACFLSWNHASCGDYERIIKEYIPWDKWLLAKATLDRTGKGTGLLVNNMKRKNSEEEFVGYLFKDTEYYSIGWDTNHCKAMYQKGLEEATIGWYTVYTYAIDKINEIENNEEYNILKMHNKISLATGFITDHYKDKISIGMILNINRLLKEKYESNKYL